MYIIGRKKRSAQRMGIEPGIIMRGAFRAGKSGTELC